MNILIVDDHPLVRKGLISILSTNEKINNIQEATNIAETMQRLIKYKPDIAIVDLNLGNEDGVDIIIEAKKCKISTKFIILTSSLKRDDYERSVRMEVDGYLLKDAFAEDILYAVNLVFRGKKYIDPEFLKMKSKYIQDGLNELTQREKDVLVELSKGLSNIQIGERLYISESTVKKHVSSILSKLQLKHRTEAALFMNKTIMLSNAKYDNRGKYTCIKEERTMF